jgi:hypothetical protein
VSLFAVYTVEDLSSRLLASCNELLLFTILILLSSWSSSCSKSSLFTIFYFLLLLNRQDNTERDNNRDSKDVETKNFLKWVYLVRLLIDGGDKIRRNYVCYFYYCLFMIFWAINSLFFQSIREWEKEEKK